MTTRFDIPRTLVCQMILNNRHHENDFRRDLEVGASVSTQEESPGIQIPNGYWGCLAGWELAILLHAGD